MDDTPNTDAQTEAPIEEFIAPDAPLEYSDFQAEEPEAPSQEQQPETQPAEEPKAPESVPEEPKPNEKETLQKSFEKRLSIVENRHRQIVAREKALQAKEAEVERRSSEYSNTLDEFKKNPVEMLKKLGLTLDDVAKAHIELTPEQQREREINEKLKEAERRDEILSEKLKAIEEHKQREHTVRELHTFGTNLRQFIEANADKYPLVEVETLAPAIGYYTRKYYEQTKKLPSFETIANEFQVSREKFFQQSLSKDRVKNHLAKYLNGSTATPAQPPAPAKQQKDVDTMGNTSYDGLDEDTAWLTDAVRQLKDYTS